jgi:hypothetical protein
MSRFLCIALLVASLAGCPSTAPGSQPGTSASSATSATSVVAVPSGSEPRWLTAASRAPAPLAEEARSARLARANTPRRPGAVDAVLDRVADQEASAAGIREAAQILHDAPPSLSDPKWAGSGTAPWARWLHVGGIALLADLAKRACAARPGDQEVTKALDAMDLPPIYNSGGVDRAQMDVQRGRIRAAAAGCAGR